MTPAHIDRMVNAQRRLMWALPAAERDRRLLEVRMDYEFEAQLSAVAHALNAGAEPIAKRVHRNFFELAVILAGMLSPVIYQAFVR